MDPGSSGPVTAGSLCRRLYLLSIFSGVCIQTAHWAQHHMICVSGEKRHDSASAQGWESRDVGRHKANVSIQWC